MRVHNEARGSSKNRFENVTMLLFAVLLFAFANASEAQEQAPPSRPVLTASQILSRSVFQFSAVGAAGLFYSIQASSNLMDWQTLAFEFSSSGRALYSDGEMANRPFRFYRTQVNPPNSVVYTNYHGWSNSITLNNGLVEAVIAPTVGRVMQFRFPGEEGPFWENTNRYGKLPSPEDWNLYTGSFGGDKSWPAPQSVWNWPPPRGFDGMTNSVTVTNGIVTLVTPVDPLYQARSIRQIELSFGEPVMRIITTFERISTSTKTNKVSVWVITQLRDPVKCYIPIPRPSIFPSGYLRQSDTAPPNLTVTNGLISFVRDIRASHKIGSDSSTLLWLGTKVALRIDAARAPGVAPQDYPDNGSSVEIYTNPDPTAYVELETLGPMEALLPGARISRTNLYRLYRRTEIDPDLEARKILGR